MKKKSEMKDTVIQYHEKNISLPPVQLLTIIFNKADEDNDHLLSVHELADYIHKRTTDHIDEAMEENYGLFMSIDTNPRNGVISWREYHEYFLQKHGLDSEYIKKHNERHQGLGRSLKENIARDRASWSEAAKSDPDFLTLDEFLAFLHPESSHSTLVTLVDDLLDKLDRDGDEMLTEDEFAVLQMSGGEELVSQGEHRRRIEFRHLIDEDGNSVADRAELLKYIDPKNPRHAKEESETLVTLGDSNHDGKLTLDEILAKMDLFLGSKMVDTARSFHDEF
uniref:Putative 45 kDa calcium-binding protein n=1 Tax=Panstrongylus lignarius TaxID=156445 RepID=A0A224XHF3_9HEMI